MTEALRWLGRARTEPDAVAAAIVAMADAEVARVAALGLRAAGSAGIQALLTTLQAEDPLVRSAMVDVVALVPDTDALCALCDAAPVERLPWLRRAIVRAVARRPESAADDALRGWAFAADPESRAEALRGLRERGTLSAPVVEGAVQATPATAPPDLVWQLAASVAACPAGPTTVLQPFRAHADPFVSAQVARALARTGHPEPDVPAEAALTATAVEALRDGSPEDRPAAAAVLRFADRLDALRAALGRLAVYQDATAELAQALHHPLPEVREIALSSLDRRRGPTVWAAYRAAVAAEPELRLRRALLWTLGRRSEPETLSPLVAIAAGDGGLERPDAVRALVDRVKRSARARLPDVLDVLILRAGEGTPAERVAAIEGLSRFSDGGAVVAVRALVDEPAPVGPAAREALERLEPDASR